MVLKLVHHCKYKRKKIAWQDTDLFPALRWISLKYLLPVSSLPWFILNEQKITFFLNRQNSKQPAKTKQKQGVGATLDHWIPVEGLCFHPSVQLAWWPAEQHKVCSVRAGSSRRPVGQADGSQLPSPAPHILLLSNFFRHAGTELAYEQKGTKQKEEQMLSITRSIDTPEQLKALY